MKPLGSWTGLGSVAMIQHHHQSNLQEDRLASWLQGDKSPSLLQCWGRGMAGGASQGRRKKQWFTP